MSAYKILLVTLVSGLCTSAFAAQSVDVTRTVKPQDKIRLSTLAGEVKIRGWNKTKVHVSGRLAEYAERLAVNTSARGIEFKVLYPHHSYGNFNDNTGSDLTIDVPRANPLAINTASADINISDVRGKQSIKSTSGNITLRSHSKDISMQSVSGKVKARGSASGAHIKAGSISGDVTLLNVNGELVANSISGDVKIEKSRMQRASIRNTSGEIDFQGAISPDGEYDFHTVSGELDLNFPAAPDARFTINTFSGDINNNFGPKAKKSSPYTSARKLSFVSGKGGAMVNINALSGKVELHAGH